MRREIERLRDDAARWQKAAEGVVNEIEQLRQWKALDKPITASMAIVKSDMDKLRAENERLQELLRNEGANRYWEGRWRDDKAGYERFIETYDMMTERLRIIIKAADEMRFYVSRDDAPRWQREAIDKFDRVRKDA